MSPVAVFFACLSVAASTWLLVSFLRSQRELYLARREASSAWRAVDTLVSRCEELVRERGDEDTRPTARRIPSIRP